MGKVLVTRNPSQATWHSPLGVWTAGHNSTFSAQFCWSLCSIPIN